MAERESRLTAIASAQPARRPASARGGAVGFVLGRLLALVPVMLFVVLITFALLHSADGSPWNRGEVEGGRGQLSDAQIAHLDAQYGLDEPWAEQLVIYLGNALRLDFGESYTYVGREVSDIILESLPYSILIGALAFAVVIVVGLGLGVAAALRHNSPLDRVATGLATLGASVPNFVTGIVLILLLSVGLNRLTGGAFFLPAGQFGLDEHLILPVITLSLFPLSYIARLTRSSVLDSLRADHVQAARAKGLRERSVVVRHVLKNSLVPVVTALGPILGFLLTGTLVVETLFQIPGLGGTFVDAVTQRDYPVVLGAAIVFALVFATANLAVDLLHALLDPRVRRA